MNSTSSLNGSSVWVRPAGAGLACGRGRAAGSGSPFGSGSVRSWAGESSGSHPGWVTSTWSGFAFLRLRTAAVRGRALRPPAGLGLVGCVRAEAVVGSSTGPTSPVAAAVVSDGDRTDRAVRAVRGGRGVGSSAAGLGVSAVVVELEPRRRAGLNGSSVWVRPAGAGLACGRGRAAGSGSPFGSGSVRSWAGESSGSHPGWVTSTWSGFAFLRLRTAAVRGRALRPPAGLGLVGCVRAEAVVGSSTGPTSPVAAAVVSDGDRTDRAVRAVRGGRGVGSSAAGLGVSAVVVELEPRRRAGLNGSSVWVRPAGAGLACGRGRAAGSGSPFGSGSVRSWAGESSGSHPGWVTSTWSGFAFLRLRTAAVRGRALRPPAGLGLVGCVRAEAVVGSSTGPTSPVAAAVVSDGDRTDRAVRAVRGGRGVGSSAAGLGVSAVVVELEPRRRAHDGAPRRSGAPLTPRDGDDADMLRSAADGGTRRVSRCRG